jgi:phage-related protein
MGMIRFILSFIFVLLYAYGICRSLYYGTKAKSKLHLFAIIMLLVLAVISFSLWYYFLDVIFKDDIALFTTLFFSIPVFLVGRHCKKLYKETSSFDKGRERKIQVLLWGTLTGVLILFNILFYYPPSPEKEVLKYLNGLPKSEKHSLIVNSENLEEFPTELRHKMLTALKEKFKNIIMMSSYESSVWRKENSQDYKDKVILINHFQKSTWSYKVCLGYRAERLAGGRIENSYYWFLGWNLYEKRRIQF